LKIVVRLVSIEAVDVKEPPRTGEYAMTNDPPIWKDFRKVLAEESDFRGPLTPLQRPEFNERAFSNDLCLVIATAETQIYANLLVTIGVVR
jgi:L-fucose mutarotase